MSVEWEKNSFWWDSNQAWGEVKSDLTFLRIYVNLCEAERHVTSGVSFFGIDNFMAKATWSEDRPTPSFGYRREHIGGTMTLMEWLGPAEFKRLCTKSAEAFAALEK